MACYIPETAGCLGLVSLPAPAQAQPGPFKRVESLAEENKVVNAVFNEATMTELLRLMTLSEQNDFEEGSPFRVLFAKKFSLFAKKMIELEAEKDPAKKEEIAKNIQEMKKSEDAHFAELKSHVSNARASLQAKDPRGAVTHLHRFGTTLLMIHEGDSRIDHFRLHNGYQSIRKVELNTEGLPTHNGGTVGSEFMIRFKEWDGNRWIYSGKVAASGHFRKKIKSYSGMPPMAILPSNTIAANAIMSVQNIIDHIMHDTLTAGLNCHPNVMRLNLCLFRAAREAGILPVRKPEGELCEGGRSDMTMEDLDAWHELRTEYFGETWAVDDFDPLTENLKKVMEKTKGCLLQCRVKISYESMARLANNLGEAKNAFMLLKEQIHEAGGKGAALVLEWGGLIAFNTNGFRNVGYEGNSMLDKEKTRDLCQIIWQHIAPLCTDGVCMQSGYPCDQQDGKETPPQVARHVTAAWVECLARTHPTEHEFAQGVGDCALALTVAQTLSHDNGHHCPGSYYQPYMSLVHITLKEYEQYKHSPLRQKRSSFAVETYDAVKRQRMM